MRKKILVIALITTIFLVASFSVSANIIKRENKVVVQQGIGTLKGFVSKFEDGTPRIEGAHVYIAGGHISIKEFNISAVLKEGITDAGGNYIIEDIPEGEYTILVLRYGFNSSQPDKWIPAIRDTAIFSGKTTEENFLLRPLSRSSILVKLFSMPSFQGLFLFRLLSIIH